MLSRLRSGNCMLVDVQMFQGLASCRSKVEATGRGQTVKLLIVFNTANPKIYSSDLLPNHGD